MKAMVYYNYGSPDVLTLKEIEKPTANDCGSAIKVNRIDVCFNLGDEQIALDWGRKEVRV